MTYGMADVVLLRQMVDGGDAGEERKRLERQKLDALLGFCESTRCRRQTLLAYFGEKRDRPCGNCDNCIDPPDTWDGTMAAQKALSCVYRTGQRFGVAHLVDVLVGKSTEKVQQFGHTRLPTFGVGGDLTELQWRGVFRQLAATGYLAVDLEGYGGLKLTAASKAVLKGEQAVTLRVQAAVKAKKSRREPATRSVERNAIAPQHEALWQALREARMALAKDQGVPPYVIFHDATLQEMLLHRPQSEDELGAISGVGERKLARYGDVFLKVLRAHA